MNIATPDPSRMYKPKLTISIDPRRIKESFCSGPHFAEFDMITATRWQCMLTGDVFDVRGLNDAWMEGRNLAPILYGPNSKVVMP